MSHFPQNNRPMFSMERKWIRSNISVHELAPNCPRCASPNTKFCYYNNYSLLQPRYFCKGCRRYWTNGGSLRNVPVGGGCRKNRRSTKRSGSNDHKANNNYSYSLWTTGNNESDCNCGDNSTGKCGNSNSASSSPSTAGLVDSFPPEHEESNGGGIDVAAVFARFLSQDSSSEDKILGQNLVDVSNSRCPDDPIFYWTKESEDPTASFPEFDQPIEGGWSRGVTIEVQGVVEGTSQEVVEMVNDENTNINDNWMVQADSNLWDFTWQSAEVELQDLSSFSAGGNHQLELPAELSRDVSTWSSFDLVAIEPSPDFFS